MDETVDFYGGYFVAVFEDSPMPNRLSLDITLGITQFLPLG